jgi:hypothetical protein
VTNIAPGTSEATITEFFGFCGRIVNIKLEEGEQSMTAYITFETVNAANTSLLLANAMIADRAIQVSMDPSSIAPASAQPSGEAAQGEFPGYPAQEDGENAGESLMGGAQRAEPNAATHAIAQLLAAGHKLSDSAVAEAKALDERFQVSNTVQAGLNDVKEALTGFSERIGLTNKAQTAYQAVATGVQSTGVPERASQAATATEGFFSAFARSASQTIQSVAQSGAQWAEENLPNAVASLRQAGSTVGAHAESIRVEAHQLYPGADEQAQAPVDPSMAPEPVAVHQEPVEAPAASPQGQTPSLI